MTVHCSAGFAVKQSILSTATSKLNTAPQLHIAWPCCQQPVWCPWQSCKVHVHVVQYHNDKVVVQSYTMAMELCCNLTWDPSSTTL